MKTSIIRKPHATHVSRMFLPIHPSQLARQPRAVKPSFHPGTFLSAVPCLLLLAGIAAAQEKMKDLVSSEP